MSTQTQPWLRAELIAAPETTPGAQLMIPADGVEFHDDQLVFHHQGDVVYVAPQSQLRSITWFAKQPNPETARRKAQWPKHGTRWTDEERTDLLRRVRAGESWKTISLAHGRSRTGCQQEAVKQGWIHPDTLRPTPELLLSSVEEDTPSTNAAPNSDSDVGTATAAAPTKAPAPDTRSADGTEPSVPSRIAAEITADSAEPSAVAIAPTADPGPANVPAFVVPAADARSVPVAVPVEVSALASNIAMPNPDRPQIPPRVPRQRTDSNPQPEPEPDDDSEKDSDPGTSPGSRFLSRAQSSLARATLGAYMTPPRGQSGTTT